MSSSASDSEEKIMKVLKKEKRDKKEKKEKKKSKSKAKDAEDEQHVADEATPSKKRKREILPEELEIDVDLPEPASKKAARKAKKAKTHPKPADGTATSTTTTGEGDTAQEASATTEHSGKRSDYGVWIGNLPWSATKDSLKNFLTENSDIKADELTRVHMPVPTKPPRGNWTSDKPTNKGFAYVDFSTQLAMYSAIALTETRMDNRPLLIKNAKNFEGRPDKPKTDDDAATAGRGGREKEMKAPSCKVFVGNLAFETSKEDLQEHFAQCGSLEHIHMATFEDSGKSKGYAWVTFEDVEAATSAVRGFVFKTEDDGGKEKKRKWRLNKLMGRDLRCEFAEDSTTRYQKRFGKEPKADEGPAITEDDENIHPDRRGRRPSAPGKPHHSKPRGKVDPRSIRPGAAHASAPRASAAIVQSSGKKTTFD